jgi:teichuronic acid biosynthesis glycosyltransferase TuaG
MFQRIFNSNNKMISILMPIYNGIEFIQDSVESILKQTYSNWELIIGINGHPQNSHVYKIAKEYENKSDKIKVFDFYILKGKSDTLNHMLNYCNYDYIALLDVDDIWYENKLESQLEYLETYDVIGSKCIYIGKSEGTIPIIPTGDISYFDFSLYNPIINSSAIIKKNLCFWKSEYDGVEDYELWLSLKNKNVKFFNVDKILVKHRIHSSSAFNSKCHEPLIKNLLNLYNKNNNF